MDESSRPTATSPACTSRRRKAGSLDQPSGTSFDLGDFKTMTRISEDFGLALSLDSGGRITLRGA